MEGEAQQAFLWVRIIDLTADVKERLSENGTSFINYADPTWLLQYEETHISSVGDAYRSLQSTGDQLQFQLDGLWIAAGK